MRSYLLFIVSLCLLSCSSSTRVGPPSAAPEFDSTLPPPSSDTPVLVKDIEPSPNVEAEPQSCGAELMSEGEIDKILSNDINQTSKEEIAAEKKRLGKFYTYRYSRRIVTGMSSALVNEIFPGYQYEIQQTMEDNTLTEIWNIKGKALLGLNPYVRVLVFKDDILVKIICQD